MNCSVAKDCFLCFSEMKSLEREKKAVNADPFFFCECKKGSVITMSFIINSLQSIGKKKERKRKKDNPQEACKCMRDRTFNAGRLWHSLIFVEQVLLKVTFYFASRTKQCIFTWWSSPEKCWPTIGRSWVNKSPRCHSHLYLGSLGANLVVLSGWDGWQSPLSITATLAIHDRLWTHVQYVEQGR